MSYLKSHGRTISFIQMVKYNLSRENGPQYNFCNAPLTSIFINMNGDVTSCGLNKTKILGNIKDSSLEEIWLGSQRNDLVNSISNYNLENGCNACQFKVEMKDYHRVALYFDNPPSFNKHKLKKITFELSNLCNLECVMCNGELSSLIRKNREHLPLKKQSDYSDLYLQLDKFISGLEFTQFLGGEPLLIKAYYKIWERIVQKNKKCIISVQTNASILPADFVKLVESTNQFVISVSIDSLNKENYERIRLNANFDIVMQNIHYLIGLKRTSTIDLFINFVPMVINYKEIPQMVDFCNSHELILSMCEVDSPFEFTFFSLSSEKLIEVIHYLQKNNPLPTNNYVGIKNQSLYEHQMLQINHIYEKVLASERYAKDLEENQDIVQLYQNCISIIHDLPVFSDTIDVFFKNQFFDKMKEKNPKLKKKAYIELNRYHFLRKGFFDQNKGERIYSENFEQLVLNEVRSLVNHILAVIDSVHS